MKISWICAALDSVPENASSSSTMLIKHNPPSAVSLLAGRRRPARSTTKPANTQPAAPISTTSAACLAATGGAIAMEAVQEARQPGPDGRHHDHLHGGADADPDQGAGAGQGEEDVLDRAAGMAALAWQRHRLVVAYQQVHQGQQQPGHADDAKGGLPPPFGGNHASEQNTEHRAKRGCGKKGAQQDTAQSLRKQAGDQRRAHRAIAGLAHADHRARRKQLAVAGRKHAGDGRQAPGGCHHHHALDPAKPVRHQRHRQDTDADDDRDDGNQAAQRLVAQVPFRLNVRKQRHDHLPVDVVEQHECEGHAKGKPGVLLAAQVAVLRFCRDRRRALTARVVCRPSSHPAGLCCADSDSGSGSGSSCLHLGFYAMPQAAVPWRCRGRFLCAAISRLFSPLPVRDQRIAPALISLTLEMHSWTAPGFALDIARQTFIICANQIAFSSPTIKPGRTGSMGAAPAASPSKALISTSTASHANSGSKRQFFEIRQSSRAVLASIPCACFTMSGWTRPACSRPTCGCPKPRWRNCWRHPPRRQMAHRSA